MGPPFVLQNCRASPAFTYEFDADGRLAIWEHFAIDHTDHALARLDELNPSVSPLEGAQRLAKQSPGV